MRRRGTMPTGGSIDSQLCNYYSQGRLQDAPPNLAGGHAGRMHTAAGSGSGTGSGGGHAAGDVRGDRASGEQPDAITMAGGAVEEESGRVTAAVGAVSGV